MGTPGSDVDKMMEEMGGVEKAKIFGLQEKDAEEIKVYPKTTTFLQDSIRVLDRTIGFEQHGDLNSSLRIVADSRDPNAGNASHHYRIMASNPKGLIVTDSRPISKSIDFQHGPVKEKGINGVSMEALLVIIKDRLEGFQTSAFACSENEQALNHVNTALRVLNERTKTRIAQNVEGESKVHTS